MTTIGATKETMAIEAQDKQQELPDGSTLSESSPWHGRLSTADVPEIAMLSESQQKVACADCAAKITIAIKTVVQRLNLDVR